MDNYEEKNIKVLCLIESLGPGGAERQLIGLAKVLKESGFAVSLMYFRPNHFYKPIADEEGIEIKYIAGTRWRVLSVPILSMAIRRYRPNVVISYLRTASVIACLAKPVCYNYKLIVSERNMTQHNSIKEWLYFWLFKRADYIVPNSYCQTNFIINNFPTLAENTFTILNFVDTERFHCREYDTNAIDTKCIKMVCVGRIDKQKNIPLFLSAIKQVVDDGMNIQVDWYGQRQNDTKGTMDALKKLSLEGVVSFINPVNDIEDKYREADVLCLPSLYEGTPNVLLEAMSCGLPVLCSDVCDNRLIVEQGVSGFLFNPFDVASIAEAIESFGRLSKGQRISMGLAARAFVANAFSKDKLRENYEKLILSGTGLYQ